MVKYYAVTFVYELKQTWLTATASQCKLHI